MNATFDYSAERQEIENKCISITDQYESLYEDELFQTQINKSFVSNLDLYRKACKNWAIAFISNLIENGLIFKSFAIYILRMNV